jgi:hypothetical protein
MPGLRSVGGQVMLFVGALLGCIAMQVLAVRTGDKVAYNLAAIGFAFIGAAGLAELLVK